MSRHLCPRGAVVGRHPHEVVCHAVGGSPGKAPTPVEKRGQELHTPGFSEVRLGSHSRGHRGPRTGNEPLFPPAPHRLRGSGGVADPLPMAGATVVTRC